jgi:predicted nucleic acid-binding protein
MRKPHAAYFDSSVLAKNYVREVGSDKARQLVRTHLVMTSSITGVELTSAFRRNLTSGSIDERSLAAIAKRFSQHRLKFRLVELTESVLEKAERYVADFDVRALDAIHLASATVLHDRFPKGLLFITSDSRQSDVAEQLGLEVLWVE